MNYENFKTLIESFQSFETEVRKYNDLGIDMFETPLVSAVFYMQEAILESHYDKDGVDTIWWWILEKSENPELGAVDKDGNEICGSLLDLYEWLEANNKKC